MRAKKPTDESKTPIYDFRNMASMSDVELIQGIAGNKIDAGRLLRQHGGLKALLTSEEAPARLLLAMELGRRGLRAQEERPRLGTPCAIYEYLAPRLGALPHEVFHVLCFNSRNVLVCDAQISTGNASSCAISPRDVFRAAVRADCAAIVLAHNHPSGDPEPSGQDLSLTASIIQAGRPLGIKVLDHIVVGDGRFVSFLERGEMSLLG